MPLAMFKIGDKARIGEIRGTDAVKKHLETMGFVPGVEVQVLQEVGGNMILGIHSGRVALSKDLAMRIHVEAA